MSTNSDSQSQEDIAATTYVNPSDSSAVAMRSVAAALSDDWLLPEPWPSLLMTLASPSNHLPVAARLELLGRFLRGAAVSAEQARDVSSSGLAAWAAGLYRKERKAATGAQAAADGQRTDGYRNDGPRSEGARYDAIVIGAPSGGVAHLAALLGAPLLSQHFAVRFLHKGVADDIAAYHAAGSKLTAVIADRNPDLAVINHYDPLHARYLVPHVNYVRVKLLELPRPYAAFIRRTLRPGGVLLYADCQYNWGQYRIGKRRSFQVGGPGDMPDNEWVKDSPQVRRFLVAHGRERQAGWSLPYPWLGGPEAEWGSLSPFKQSVEDFASAYDYRFRVLRGTHPEDFARVAFYASYQAALDAGQEPAGVLVGCANELSPTAALRNGLLPLWLTGNSLDSLAFLKSMAVDFPRGKPVLLAPMTSFSESWNVPSAEQWLAACGRAAGGATETGWLGADVAAYPADLMAPFRFAPALQAWCAAHAAVPRPSFTVDDLVALIGRMAAQQAGAQEAEAQTGARNATGESGKATGGREG